MNVTKIIPTKCQIFHLKCTKFNFGWAFAPDPIAGFGEREGKGEKETGRERRKKEGREGGSSAYFSVQLMTNCTVGT